MAIQNGKTADADDINAELSALAADISALDAAAVKLSGNQTVQGVKTFGSIPVLPASDPTTDNQAVRKAFLQTFLASMFPYVAGDSISKTVGSGETNKLTYTKVIEKTIHRGGTIRLKFYLRTGGALAYGQIYRNGVAVGTEQTSSSTGSPGDLKSEDISGWAAGDLLQVYAKTSHDIRTAWINNLTLCEALELLPPT